MLGLALAMAQGCDEPTTRVPSAAEAPPAPSEPANELPSVVLVTIDTTRADHLSVYGYPRETSPHLDELAQAGVRVEQAFTPMPTTDPAHVSMLTGLYPRTHGARRNGVGAVRGLDNLAAWARASGRATAAFVSRQHVSPSELHLAGFESEDGPSEPQRDGGETLRRALAWIDGHDDEPFFLWVHLFDPHRPYFAPEPFGSRFTPVGAELPRIQETNGLTEERARLFIGQYDGEVAYTDHLVGRLAARLRRFERRPLMVIAADHGEAMDEDWARHRFAFGHGKHLNLGIDRVPLLLHWPGHVRARTVPGPVSLVDLPSTIFAALGEAGFASQGRSILDPAYQARAVVSERRSLDERYRVARALPVVQHAVHDASHMLVVSDDQQVELYESSAPTEDVAEQHPDTVARLRGVLETWRERTPERRAAATPIDPDRRQALRALGYVE